MSTASPNRHVATTSGGAWANRTNGAATDSANTAPASTDIAVAVDGARRVDVVVSWAIAE